MGKSLKTKPTGNTFFDKFVTHEDDIVGYLAYALYEKAWQRHKNTLKGKYADGAIPEFELKAFESMFEGQILGHRTIAEQMLNKRYEDFANKVHLQISTIENHTKLICEHIDSIPQIHSKVHQQTSFFGFSFWQNVVASAAFPILLGLGVVLYQAGSDENIWKKFGIQPVHGQSHENKSPEIDSLQTSKR